jgi:uncharacterized protein YdgA (DUF945 family)
MMIKITLITSILLSLIALIPYWTGIEAEKQLHHFNQDFYSTMNLQLVENHYQRGWFHSWAQSTLEMPKTSVFSVPNHRLVLTHEVDHGLLPVQPTLIHTQLQTDTHDTTFLQINTVVQGNGESISTFEMMPLTLQEEKIHLQLQNLQGKVRLKFPSAIAQVELHNPQVQLTTAIYQLLLQNVMLNTKLSTKSTEYLQGMGYLTIEQSNFLLREPQVTSWRLQKIHLVAHNDILSDYLTTHLKVDLQNLEVGTDSYGPNRGELELHHWHVPTLKAFSNNWLALQQQDLLLSPTYLNFLPLMPSGINLLQHNPQVAVKELKINTAAGELSGTMQLKFEANQLNYFALLNPTALINGLRVQAQISLPQPLLVKMIQWAKTTFPLSTATGISWEKLITLEKSTGYASIQLQLEQGVLQINGKPRFFTK